MSVEFELKNETFFIKRSKKYDNIYDYFYRKRSFTMSELFTLCAVIGFTNNNKVSFKDKGKDIRSEYVLTNELMNIYTIMIRSNVINATLDDFNDSIFRKEKFKDIEEYAEGGMQILCDEVFTGNWDGHELNSSYNKYEIDILSYINEKRNLGAF
ncbi:hypothetical protein [Paraclostridium bifermentans]|uniref:hypothetical protein n=1 Tax=Paraclostridium bifermentans TaxID=1490 RepID=UPI0004242C78|nr:hypothetical protein [Paraclostridium bifermentans]